MEKHYHKKAGHRSYGIRTPEFRELAKAYLTCFKSLSLKERLELAKMLFKSGFSEQAGIGNVILEKSIAMLTTSEFDFLDDVASCLNNWSSTDSFSIHTVQPLLRKYPREILGLLRKWNVSKSMWKQRASVVTFTRSVGASGEFTNEALELCDNLIWDEEDLVRKAVGWALKDSLRGARMRVLDYVKSLRQRGVSSVITLYAIRDLKERERQQVLKAKPR